MSTPNTNTPTSTGGDTANEPITKQFFLELTPESFSKLPAAQQKAVVQWLLNNPHQLDARPQTSTSKKETK